jgi:hypothetical protein
MSSKFFSLSHSLSLSGHPVAPQGRNGGPDCVRHLAVVYDRQRGLFQAIFFGSGLEENRLARDIAQAGYTLHAVLPVPAPAETPAPGRKPRRSQQSTRPAAAASTPSDTDLNKAEQVVGLLRQLLSL